MKKEEIYKTEAGQSNSSVKEELLFLLAKIVILAGLLLATFVFIFGIFRCEDNAMYPAIKSGDLIFYYRLQKNYNTSEAVVIEKDGEMQVRRIIAGEGDVVEITADGLKINGYLQQETGIYSETLPYTEGIEFPLKIGKDEYFVLGDTRTNTRDSRLYGAVKRNEIKGSVMTLLRRRGI